MINIQAGDLRIAIYDSIHSIPPHRESLFNYYLLGESGIGHDITSISTHLDDIYLAALQGDMESVNLHRENTMNCFLFIADRYNPKYMAWLALIHSVNDELITDVTDSSLRALGQRISEQGGVNMGWEDVLETVKKKFPENLQSTFPVGSRPTNNSTWLKDLFSQRQNTQ